MLYFLTILMAKQTIKLLVQIFPTWISVSLCLYQINSIFRWLCFFRGCLFYGPPGTGKTLVARALANECSHGDRKVSFFMRKGADCLSKWVGESERQLRLLFDQVGFSTTLRLLFSLVTTASFGRSFEQIYFHFVSHLLYLNIVCPPISFKLCFCLCYSSGLPDEAIHYFLWWNWWFGSCSLKQARSDTQVSLILF